MLYVSWNVKICLKISHALQICYCNYGEVVCSTRQCPAVALEFANCIALPVAEGQCCPNKYVCDAEATGKLKFINCFCIQLCFDLIKSLT
jgi:hypothetical protein